MLNRDEKYQGSDEPEYHFSDEESGEYADTELPKEEVISTASEPREGKTKFAPSKRMLMSLVVFLALVYVVYKMVAPTSQTPTTDITTPVTAQATTPSEGSNRPMQRVPAAPVAMNSPSVIPVTTPTPQVSQANNTTGQGMPQQQIIPQEQQSMSQQQQIMPQQQPVMPQQQQIMPQQQPVMPQQQQIMPQQQPVMPQQQQIMPQQQPVMPQQQPSNMPQSQMMPQQQIIPQQVMPQSSQNPQNLPQQATTALAQQGMAMVNGMASVIPMPSPSSSAPPAYGTNYNNPNVMPSTQNATGNEAKIAALQNDASKLMGDLQSNYVQKLNDFSEQNKALQEQIQTLSARMITMETQMNQLVQALTHQEGQNIANEPVAPSTQSARDQKNSYNVQAIIPGRAWLRTENGDTLTVAEGDVIKSLGRVTKIDPYDGVVEINTGNKTLSLSYGTSA